MANSSNLCNDAIDAIRPDLEAFASLWTTLRVTYVGTNITKAIAQLLHMYQPEDGIQAYERLLKTLFVLLENFDCNGLRLLVSMVPPPKGSSDETIREVFFKTTGFIRIDAPIFHQNYPLLSSMTNTEDDEIKNENDCDNIVNQSIRESVSIKYKNIDSTETLSRSESPQILSQENYSFRGFPSTEMYSQNQNIQGHNSGQFFMSERRNDPISNLSMTGYKMNWRQTPYCLQSGNTPHSNSPYRDVLVKTMDNKYLRVPIAHCSPNVHYFNRPYQMVSADRNVQLKDKHTNSNKLLMNSSQTQVSGALYVKSDKKEKCDETTDARIHSDLNEHNYNSSKNEEEKSKEINTGEFQDIIRNEIYKMDVVNCENHASISIEDCALENLTAGNNLVESIKNFLKRAAEDESCDLTGDVLKIEKNMTDDTVNKYIYGKKNLSSQSQKSTENVTSHVTREMKNYQNEINDTSHNLNYQSNSMSELAAYKRQYYDALLSIQRAKMVVANSLILSPLRTRNDYDAYHPDNFPQHHWMFQQPQRLIVGPSYAQRLVQPEYATLHNTCARSNDWMANYSLSRKAQETPSMHTSYDSRFAYSNYEPASQINDSIPGETKLEAKKRKLENIVVKLKENEMNSIHN